MEPCVPFAPALLGLPIKCYNSLLIDVVLLYVYVCFFFLKVKPNKAVKKEKVYFSTPFLDFGLFHHLFFSSRSGCTCVRFLCLVEGS